MSKKFACAQIGYLFTVADHKDKFRVSLSSIPKDRWEEIFKPKKKDG